MRMPLSLSVVAAALALSTPSGSQLPQLGGSGLSGLAGALGGSGGALLPNLGSQSAGNAAGLLGYCVKNKLLGAQAAGGASSVLGALTGQGKVEQKSKSYQAGQSGQLLAGDQAVSLDGVKGTLKTKLCDMVLQHARSFL